MPIVRTYTLVLPYLFRKLGYHCKLLALCSLIAPLMRTPSRDVPLVMIETMISVLLLVASPATYRGQAGCRITSRSPFLHEEPAP